MTGGSLPNAPGSRARGGRGDGGKRGQRRPTATSSSTGSVQSTSSPTSPTTPGSSKVAIPRLYSEDHGGGDGKTRDASKIDRTNHACEPCRTRKTKCSGERPTCKHCRQFNITCVYADGKRDRARRHQEQMEYKLVLYETLLTEAGPSMGPTVWSRFQRARLHDADLEYQLWEGPEGLREVESRETTRGENTRSASEGSIDAVDSVSEDISRNARTQAAGYLGKTSEVDWQRDLNKKEDNVQAKMWQGASAGQTRKADTSVSALSYQSNHKSIPEINNPNLKLYEAPPPQIAQYLKDVFFKTVYPSFPLLPKYNFEQQLKRAYNGNFEGDARPSDRWRAIMNLVFAIGSRYLKLTENIPPLLRTNHETFFARAAHLALLGKHVLHVPDLQQVQIFGLSALYLTIINHMNRAWLLSGQATRSAIALGLQVELKTSELGEIAKEARYRLWWAVYGLEIMLSIMTGRPPAISLRGFSTPLPVPYDEERYNFSRSSGSNVNMARFHQTSYRNGSVPNQTTIPNISTDAPTVVLSEGSRAEALSEVDTSDSLYLIFRTRLLHIAHEVLETLYQPASAHILWSQVQVGVDSLNTMLNNFQAGLPAALDFRKSQDNEWNTNRNRLAILFYNARILTNRPCLCDLSQTRPGETANSREFNTNSASLCVQSARDVIRLLPREIRAADWVMSGPWWPMIHHILTATTVLTITLFYECKHVGAEHQPEVIREAKHGLIWLHALAQEPNEGAERAWKLAASTLARLGHRMQFDLSDVPMPSEVTADPGQQQQPALGQPHHDQMPSAIPAYDAPYMNLPQPVSMAGEHAADFTYPDFGEKSTADYFSNDTNIDPMLGYLFTSYTAPVGSPMHSEFAFSSVPGAEDYVSPDTSHIDPSLDDHHPYYQQSMTDPRVNPYLSGQGNIGISDPQEYPVMSMPIAEGQGASMWPTSEQMAPQMQPPNVQDGEMEIEYSTPQPPDKGKRRSKEGAD